MPIEIRVAGRDDVPRLEALENAADERFLILFRPDRWSPADTGEARASTPGFVLVAAETAGAEAVGFVHVIERDGLAHLEQLSVHPEQGRRGYGRALVDAAKSAAAARGHERMTLRTYADVPWNGPFYTSCGFAESAPDSAFLHELAAVEERLGLGRHGRRIQMTAAL